MLDKLAKSIEDQKARLADFVGVLEQVAQLKGAIAALEYTKALLEAEKKSETTEDTEE